MKIKSALCVAIISILLISAVFVGLSSTLAQPTPSPRHLTANGYEGYIRIEWDPPASQEESLSFYRIYRSLDPEYKNYLHSVDKNTRRYKDSDVEEGRTYYYWITAVYEGYMESEFSNRAEARAQGASAPKEPRELKAYAGDGKVELSWKKPEDDGGSDIENYKIYRGVTSGEETWINTIGTVTKFTDTSVVNGETYYYVVTALNDIGESPVSNEVSATPSSGISEPDSPRNLRAMVGNEFVELHWDPPLEDGGSSIKYYKVRRTMLIPRTFTTDGDETYYIDEDVDNGFTYYYQVSAVNSEGEGLTSNQVKAEPTGEDIPSAPTNLDAQSGENKISLTWNQPSDSQDITDYHIYRGENTKRFTFLANTGGDKEYTDQDVEEGKSYYYKVRAISEDKIGLESNIDSATPMEKEDISDDEEESGFSLPLLWILIIAIIVLAGLFVLSVFLKRGKEPSGPQPQRGWQHEAPEGERTPPPPGATQEEGGYEPSREGSEEGGEEKEKDEWMIEP